MAVPTWSQQVDQLFTSTWAYRRKTAQEQAFLKTPLIFWLKQRGRVEDVRGFTRIEIPLDYGTNDTVRWIGRGSTVPINDPNLLTMAYEDWKYVSVSIVRYGVDDQKNRDKARLLNLVETKLRAAERALMEEFERVFFGDGTGPSEPNGLRNIIADDPTTGTLHGIDRATYTWFRNQSKTASGAASIYLKPDMRTLMNDVVKYSNAEISDLILVTNQTVYELYEDEVLEEKLIVNKELGDAGFQNIAFKGRPLIWSPSAPAGKLYVINANHLKLVIDPDWFMEMTDWKVIPDQPHDRVAQITCALNLVTDRPVVLGVLTGISA